jgi:hypothetical protein
MQCTEIILRLTVAHAMERVKTFNLGAKVVPPVTIIYPIDFSPLPEDTI